MKTIKEKVKKIPVLGKISLKIYKKLFPEPKLNFLIQRYLSHHKTTIIQIGSNDGKTGDPIYSLLQKNEQWKAVMVEPVPYLYKRLKSNYPNDPRFIFENTAINHGSMQTFYSVKQEAKNQLKDLPPWFDQLGSFYKENITKQLNGILEPYIEEIQLQGITLNNLFKKHDIKSIGLLHIDTEGYDWKVLSQLNLEKYKPILILYEQKHLPKSQRVQSIAFLKKDYVVYDFSSNYLAINKKVLKRKDKRALQKKKIA